MPAISHVFTAAYVAAQLGEGEDFLHQIAADMTPEDGCIHVINSGGEDEETLLTFTQFGIENLRDLIPSYKDDALFTETKAVRAPAKGP